MDIFHMVNTSGARSYVSANDEEEAKKIAKAAGFFRKKPKRCEIVTNRSYSSERNFPPRGQLQPGIMSITHTHTADPGQWTFSMPPSLGGDIPEQEPDPALIRALLGRMIDEDDEEYEDTGKDFDNGAYVQAWVWVNRRTKRSPTVSDYRKWAKEEFHEEGRIEIDDNARVSDTNDAEHETANPL